MNAPGDPTAFTARLLPSGRVFEAPAGQPLLLSAAIAGIAFDSSCRNGTCRTCLRRLLGGEVRYRVPWPGLLPEEKQEGGWVLPCVAFPLSDVTLAD